MAIKRKTRMYEPWGYQDQNNYQSTQIIAENDLDGFFSGVSYKREDNKIHFTNKDGDEVGSLNVNDFIKSDQIVEKAWYEDGKIYVKFTNGDLITVDVRELIDENEFADGLQVIDGVVSVLRDPQSERWLAVSSNGVKVSGIQAEIDRLDGRIDDEIARATSEEQRIEARLDQEIADRIADVDEEQARAEAAEQVLTTNLNNEITRATQTEQGLNHRVDTLNDELDAEESIREANDAALGLRITTETNDRISAVAAEKNRAETAERALQTAISNEVSRATSAETELQGSIENEVTRASGAENTLNLKIEAESERAIQKELELDERIDDITSGSTQALDNLIEKLGYKDNDTLQTRNQHEVAFGEWNESHTSVESSGQTIFSVGIGTSAHDRKNALEVMKDGTIYAWVEGDYVDITKILGQLVHEVYDTNP